MLELCQRREMNYNSRLQTNFSLRSINTNSHSLKSLRYLAPKIWNLVPQDMRSANSLPQLGRLNRGYLIVVLVFYVAHILVN